MQKIAIWALSYNFVDTCLSCPGSARQSEKNLLNSNIASTCPHNKANFGPSLPIWGTSAHFNGFRVLAALLHGTLVVAGGRQPNFAALNRGRHLYSAGRPSRWALAHILVASCISSEPHAAHFRPAF